MTDPAGLPIGQLAALTGETVKAIRDPGTRWAPVNARTLPTRRSTAP
ncbi:hypothetical protein ACFSC4_22155 [Deinococcus malanensis]|nr:hypothetical protein [Deinococcus malanensis]